MNTRDIPHQDEFEEISKRMIKWLNDNVHPHMTVIIDSTSAELVEGVKSVVTTEFVKD